MCRMGLDFFDLERIERDIRRDNIKVVMFLFLYLSEVVYLICLVLFFVYF